MGPSVILLLSGAYAGDGLMDILFEMQNSLNSVGLFCRLFSALIIRTLVCFCLLENETFDDAWNVSSGRDRISFGLCSSRL